MHLGWRPALADSEGLVSVPGLISFHSSEVNTVADAELDDLYDQFEILGFSNTNLFALGFFSFSRFIIRRINRFGFRRSFLAKPYR